MIYTSFVVGEDYKKVIEEYLIPSLEKFNLPYNICYIKDSNNWTKNIQHKPQFIKDMLLKHKQGIVALDSDAQILKRPFLFDEFELKNYDIALHYLDNGLQWRNIPSPKEIREALGGTLYFAFNEKVLKFVDEWIEVQKIDKGYPQKTMQKLLKKNTYNLNIYKLPYSYATIIKQNGFLPTHMIKKFEIVILHNQVSRRLKNKRR